MDHIESIIPSHNLYLHLFQGRFYFFLLFISIINICFFSL